jgi:hypothetical protein
VTHKQLRAGRRWLKQHEEMDRVEYTIDDRCGFLPRTSGSTPIYAQVDVGAPEPTETVGPRGGDPFGQA